MYIEDKDLDDIINPTRRGFLGSIIGTFVAANLPWIAAIPKDKPIKLPENCLPDWKNYIRLTNDLIIQGSGVKDIDKEGKLILHDIMATQNLRVFGSILEYKGRKLSDMPFYSGNQYMCNGDILKITHTLNFTLPDNKTMIHPDHKDWDYWIQRKFEDENKLHGYKKLFK